MITPGSGAGELRETIDILEVREPYSITGEGTVVKEIASGIRAKIEPLGGSVAAETMQIQESRQQYRVWIRYRDGVTAFQQLQWRGRRLMIDGPPEHLEQWILLHVYSVTVRKL